MILFRVHEAGQNVREFFAEVDGDEIMSVAAALKATIKSYGVLEVFRCKEVESTLVKHLTRVDPVRLKFVHSYHHYPSHVPLGGAKIREYRGKYGHGFSIETRTDTCKYSVKSIYITTKGESHESHKDKQGTHEDGNVSSD